MNLDELQSVQARERQSSDLQHLRPSFYREVGEFVERLSEERARAVEAADDPFSSPEVRRLTDDIETAEQTVEAIYERRVGKVVKKASIAAAGMPVDDDGLTDEEEALFEDLVARIERNREAVLSATDGEGPSVSCSVDAEADADAEPDVEAAAPDAGREPSPSGDEPPVDTDVSAAELMGTDDGPPSNGETADGPANAEPSAAEGSAANPAPTPAPQEPSPPTAEEPPSSADGSPTERANAESGSEDETEDATTDAGGPERRSAADPTDEESSIPGLPRTTVRITDDVGEVVGADDRDYDLGAGTVVTLPEPNAEVLVDKDAAERL